MLLTHSKILIHRGSKKPGNGHRKDILALRCVWSHWTQTITCGAAGHAHSTGEETKAGRSEVTRLRFPRRWKWQSRGSELDSLWFQVLLEAQGLLTRGDDRESQRQEAWSLSGCPRQRQWHKAIISALWTHSLSLTKGACDYKGEIYKCVSARLSCKQESHSLPFSNNWCTKYRLTAFTDIKLHMPTPRKSSVLCIPPKMHILWPLSPFLSWLVIKATLVPSS